MKLQGAPDWIFSRQDGGCHEKIHELSAIPLAFSLAGSIAIATEKKIELKPAELRGGQGEAVVKDVQGDQKEITVKASGLKPNSVYTLWFVNETPKMDMAGAGKPDYDFKSDAQGNATYTATAPASDLTKWQILEVAFHPDGDPKNMKNIKAAFKGKLR